MLLLILMSLFLLGCAQASDEEAIENEVVPEVLDADEPESAAQPLPNQAEAGTEEPEVEVAGEAPVDTIEVQFLDSGQPQVVISGNLPDGCTEIATREVEQQGDTFQVTLTTQRLTGQMCTEALVPYQEVIRLEINDLPEGEYTVAVSGQSETFSLGEEQAAQEATFESAEEAEAFYVDEAKAALAQQQSVEPDQIQVESVSQIEGQEGVYSIRLQLDGHTYEYHGQDGQVLALSEPLPTAESVPVEAFRSQEELIDALASTGAIVQPAGEEADVPEAIFSAPGRVVTVSGADVYVYEYENEAAAEADAARISADGSEIGPGEGSGPTTIGWVGTPHFYRNGRFLVLYLGDEVETLNALQIVFGPQFAGGEVAGTATTPEAEDVN
jgi:hypothetical protein